ncbi:MULTISPECIES: hypothetical protein [Methylobacterium]|jgi:uncharacterized membrane protein HdeD (DUF308 family)|uniref:Holin n=1 Tax=Methylobacterium hispanicum TaxID=270350 RepID=A0AAV4ZWG7_9HYPH|nr:MULTISPECIES: hypothetical protein [Methylobacterium]GJD92502.1 hypothetical protein BHAOGJBA_6056 [Methylobacterium hispanicum]
MMKFVTPGVVAGVLTMAGVLSVAVGKPALGAFLSDPATAATVTAVVSGVGALLAGVLQGVKNPAA